jgi:hypothetical protein
MTTLHDQWAALYTAGRVRWMAGMSDGCYRVTHSPSEDGEWVDVTCDGRSFECRLSELTEPDFSDPATIGCLLHQAREAWGRPCVTVARTRIDGVRMWHVIVSDDCITDPLDSEPAAILAAIAAAPPKVNP